MEKTNNRKNFIGFLISSVFVPLIVALPSFAFADYVKLSQKLTLPGVKDAWNIVLGLVNIIAVLGLIIIALAYLFRIDIETYDIKRTLPGLIIGIILANFSYFLCTEAADFIQSISNFFNHAAAGHEDIFFRLVGYFAGSVTASGSTLATVPITAVVIFLAGGTLSSGGAFLAALGIASLIVAALILIVPALLWLLLAALLYIRYYVITILLVISPVAIVLYFLPFGKELAGKWLDWFIKWLLVGPLVFILLWLMGIFMGDTSGTTIGGVLGTIILSALLVMLPYQLVNMGNLLNKVWSLTGGLLAGYAMGKGQTFSKAAWNNLKKKAGGIPWLAKKLDAGGKKMAEIEAAAQGSEKIQEKRVEQALKVIEEREIKALFNRMAGYNGDGYDNLPAFFQALDQKDPDAALIQDYLISKAQRTAENQTPEAIAAQMVTKKDIRDLDNLVPGLAMEMQAGDARYGTHHDRALEIRKDMNIVNRPDKGKTPDGEDDFSIGNYQNKFSAINDDAYISPLFPKVENRATSTSAGPVSHSNIPTSTRIAVENAIKSGATFKQAIEIIPELEGTERAKELFKVWQQNLEDELSYHDTTVRNALEIIPQDTSQASRIAIEAGKYLQSGSPSAQAKSFTKKITGADVELGTYEVETTLRGYRDGVIAREIASQLTSSLVDVEQVVKMSSTLHRSERVLSGLGEEVIKSPNKESVTSKKANIAFDSLAKIINQQYDELGVNRTVDFSDPETRIRIVSQYSAIKENEDYNQRLNFFRKLI